jgi:hypothetical protein
VGEWFRWDGVVEVLLIERWMICLETGDWNCLALPSVPDVCYRAPAIRSL